MKKNAIFCFFFLVEEPVAKVFFFIYFTFVRLNFRIKALMTKSFDSINDFLVGVQTENASMTEISQILFLLQKFLYKVQNDR